MDTLSRWEWRAFARDFGESEARIRACPGESRQSRETYLLSHRSSANTKIRCGVLDVKLLQRVDHAGLELWMPALKAPFPLGADAVRQVFAAWALPAPDVGMRPMARQEFLDALVAPRSDLARIEVGKTRFLTRVGGCLVEVADLTFDDAPIRTIAVELEDPDRVWQTVRALGLSAHENVNYVRALKRFVELHAH
jgi:exopolyphosphatase/guanosine-5'-triphosphate,3'-diphosphate pyrophosphatase